MDTQNTIFANPGALGVKPYVPGKSAREASRELGLSQVVKLASNENPHGSSPLARQALAGLGDRLHLYPDSTCEELRGRLSNDLGVSPEEITVGNGVDGVIYNLGMACIDQGDEAVIPRVSYPMYETIVRVMRGAPVFSAMKGLRIDLQDMRRRISPRTKAVFLCNPNNPTGDALPREELIRFVAEAPATVLIVLDEAYIDFTDPGLRPGSVSLFREGRKNLFILRTFSKLYGLAGVRIGYGLGDRALVVLIHRIKPPFAVSSLAEQLALKALEDVEFARRTLEDCSRQKRAFYEQLESLGLGYVPSHTNFVLVDTGRDAQEIFEGLLARGLIVRPGKQYGLPTHIRVTVGLQEENKRLFQALRETLAVRSS